MKILIFMNQAGECLIELPLRRKLVLTVLYSPCHCESSDLKYSEDFVNFDCSIIFCHRFTD